MDKKRSVLITFVVLVGIPLIYVLATTPVSFSDGPPSEEYREKVVTKEEFYVDYLYVNESGGSPRLSLRLAGPGGGLLIDLRSVTVVWQGPNGNRTLHPADDFDDPTSIDGREFAYQMYRDANDSAPVIDDYADEFGLFIKPQAFTNLSNSRGEPVTICVHAPEIRSASFEWTVRPLSELNFTRTTPLPAKRGSGCANRSQTDRRTDASD